PRPRLRDLQALLRLCPRQRARPAALRPRELLSPSRLGRSPRRAPGAARLPPHPLLLRAHGLRPALARGAARRRLSVDEALRIGGTAPPRRRVSSVGPALSRSEPGRQRPHGGQRAFTPP